MKNFIELIYHGIWDAVINEPYVTKHVINNELVDKL